MFRPLLVKGCGSHIGVLNLQMRWFEMFSCPSGVTGIPIGRLVEIGPHLIINSKDEFLILKEVQLVPGRDPLVVG